MQRILIVDLETTGLDPEKDRAIEVGAILWDVQNKCIVEMYSALLDAPAENPAEHINAIPSGALRDYGLCRLLQDTEEDPSVWQVVQAMERRAEAILAHNASFDKSFAGENLYLPWIDSDDDIPWPIPPQGSSLIALALAHKVPVVSTHRAIEDCLLLARVLERLCDLGHDVSTLLDSALDRAQRPKFKFVALVSYEDRQHAKNAGFRWDPDSKEWFQVMSEDDAAALTFRTRRS